MDPDAGGRQKHDFSDIMSILGEEQKPEAVERAPAKPRDEGFIRKLMADIEQKNAEILKLNADNMALKYSVSEKELEIKRLQGQADSLRDQSEGLKAQVVALGRQVEDLSRFAEDARARLGEMDADRAKLNARLSKDEAAPPEDEDVESIFRRIALDKKPEDGAQDGGADGKPQKKTGTAKLYDL